MNVPDIDNLLPTQCRESHIKAHYPKFYEFLIAKYPSYLKFGEKLYWYNHNLNERPGCLNCGKPTKFYNCKNGYAMHCCSKCSNSDKNKIENTKKYFREHYGGNAPICDPKVKSKIKATNIERYGAENCQQNKDIKQKTHNTIIELYGGIGNASSLIKEKYENTCIERYGVDNSSKSEAVKEKISISKRKHEIERNDNFVIEYIEKDGKLFCLCECPHLECNKCKERRFIIESSLLANRLSHKIELCTNLLPYKSLTSSYELCLQRLLDEYDIKYITNCRDIISKELDIYIPSKNIAIEFNGVFHHSDIRKPQRYHIDKFNACKEKGIQLITVWLDQYEKKQDIVKSIILSKLGIYERKIYGRQCAFEIADSKTANDFYDNNHIQGKCNANIHYALRYDNDIVAMMSFGKRSLGKNSNSCWELIRYCSKANTLIIGGVSRLFTRFVKDYSPNEIISWSSNDISDGDMYRMLGFEYIKESESYWYVHKNTYNRYHRLNFTKSNLIKKGIISEDENKTENQIAYDLGFLRIFDSGQTKWLWTAKQ